jgi:prophage regulatory protein
MFTAASHHPESSNRLLRMPDTRAVTGLGRSTVYRLVSQGLFPPPVKLGPRSVAWPAGEVEAINAARIAAKSDDDIRLLVKRLMAARKTLVSPTSVRLSVDDRAFSLTSPQDPDDPTGAAGTARAGSCHER